MKKTLGMLMVLAFAFSIATVALARGAPTKQKAFTSGAIVAETVAPTVALVPVMNGYDVIENITTGPRDLSIAQSTFDVDTSAQTRLSSTGAWHSHYSNRDGRARSSPMLTMKM